MHYKVGMGRWISYILSGMLVITAAVFLGHLTADLWSRTVIPTGSTGETEGKDPFLVIDPGHGGEDGGASSADGILEKELNLQIAQNLSDIAGLFGYKTVMTRTTDSMLYDLYNDLDDYTGYRKTYDLRNRLRLAKDLNGEIFVSIHMNKFPEPQYKGLQVYYSPNHTDSQKIAAFIQSYARTYIQPENTREIKEATSSIYLLHRIKTPAVLVECGFLSNPEETDMLTTPEYRCRLAGMIFASTAEWYESGKIRN